MTDEQLVNLRACHEANTGHIVADECCDYCSLFVLIVALKAQPAEHSPWDKPCEHQATQFSYPTGDILVTKAWCLTCVTKLGRAFDEMRGEVERMKGKNG